MSFTRVLLLHVVILLGWFCSTCQSIDASFLSQIDTKQLPNDMSLEEAADLAQATVERVLNNIIAKQGVRSRSLLDLTHSTDTSGQTKDRECNTLIGTVTRDELRDDVLMELQEQNVIGAALFALEVFVLSWMTYDVQIYKICGRCSDFDDSYNKTIGCREQDYGYNALHSGILIAPFDSASGKFLELSLPVNIVPTAGGFIPSETQTHPLTNYVVLVGAFVSSVTRAYTLIPDYIGMGESSEYYRAFLVQQSILTATVPLIWQAEDLISRESNCASAMSDSYSMVGYSQGGYGSIALATGLSRMGKSIIAVHSAGAPYRISTSTLTSFVRTLQTEEHAIVFFIALLAAALSSTTTDAANYGTGQDFLAEHVRDAIVAEAQVALLERAPIYDIIPNDNPLSIFNPDLIAQVEDALSRGDQDPCATSEAGKTDKLCEALRQQDLVGGMESANYPIYLCHSREDQLIPYSNLPNASANPEFLHVRTTSGDHAAAAVPCIVNMLWYFVNPTNIKLYSPEEKTLLGGCDSGVAVSRSVGRRCGLISHLFGLCN